MIRVKCHTNIDRFNSVEWPERMAGMPAIGHYVEGKSSLSTSIQLQIVRITHSYDRIEKVPVLLIELHQ